IPGRPRKSELLCSTSRERGRERGCSSFEPFEPSCVLFSNLFGPVASRTGAGSRNVPEDPPRTQGADERRDASPAEPPGRVGQYPGAEGESDVTGRPAPGRGGHPDDRGSPCRTARLTAGSPEGGQPESDRCER